MALILTLEPTSSKAGFSTAQQLIAAAAAKVSVASARSANPKPGSAAAPVDFSSDIRPILERSCVNCHSGEKPKGSYDLTARDTALKGGQSGEPAILSGKSDVSPLIRFVQDQVEDLEMPPLGKRERFPALTKDETARLRAWIEQGAVWPEGVTLRASGK